MKLNSTIVLTLCVLGVTGCSSLPTRTAPILDISEEEKIYPPIAIVGCEVEKLEYSDSVKSRVCDVQIAEFSEALKDTGIFQEVIIGESEKATYKASIKAVDKRPYQFSIGHNPGILLLSAVIPFWENEIYGYEFKLENIKDGRTYEIDTLEEGTFLMWSGSMLINLSPKRGIPGTHYQTETEYLRNTILNVIGEKAPNNGN